MTSIVDSSMFGRVPVRRALRSSVTSGTRMAPAKAMPGGRCTMTRSDGFTSQIDARITRNLSMVWPVAQGCALLRLGRSPVFGAFTRKTATCLSRAQNGSIRLGPSSGAFASLLTSSSALPPDRAARRGLAAARVQEPDRDKFARRSWPILPEHPAHRTLSQAEGGASSVRSLHKNTVALRTPAKSILAAFEVLTDQRADVRILETTRLVSKVR